MSNRSQLTLVDVLRWIAVLPIALAAGLAARAVFVLVNRWTMEEFVAPDSFMGQLFLLPGAGIVCGVSMVLGGVYVAPSAKHNTAYTLAGLVILLAGFGAYPAVVRDEYRELVELLFTALGAGGVAREIIAGTLVLDHE